MNPSLIYPAFDVLSQAIGECKVQIKENTYILSFIAIFLGSRYVKGQPSRSNHFLKV